MFIVTISEQDLSNLMLFMDKVEMKGRTEAIAMVNILNALNKAIKTTEQPAKEPAVQKGE